MNVPLSVIKLREKYNSRGDNKIIAERASKGIGVKTKFNNQHVVDMFRHGRALAKLVLAANDYYKEVEASLKHVEQD